MCKESRGNTTKQALQQVKDKANPCKYALLLMQSNFAPRKPALNLIQLYCLKPPPADSGAPFEGDELKPIVPLPAIELIPQSGSCSFPDFPLCGKAARLVARLRQPAGSLCHQKSSSKPSASFIHGCCWMNAQVIKVPMHTN